MKQKNALLILLGLICTGCAGKVDYVKPTVASSKPKNSITVNMPRDNVWNSAIPQLSKQFFVINNLEKVSGLISLSYSGNPESYIDCGRLTYFVKNLRGERTYDFPASKAEQKYEVMGDKLYAMNRKMQLEGRVNLIFEEINSSQTRITANIKYVLSKTITQQAIGDMPQTGTDSISFNSGETASFPQGTECTPTGKLESEILQAVQI